MKKLLFIILLFFTAFVVGQEVEKENLIQLDSTWGKEMFPFPIRFAKNINYEGVAEVRFPPKGWRTIGHDFFWTYTYAWSIDIDREITATELTSNLEKYFDGLNNVTETNNVDQKATATISKTKRKKRTTFFKGSVDTYDHFATNKRIVLNVLIESHYYKKEKKTVLLFKFSPKDYIHKVWETLKNIQLNEHYSKF
ncbi:MAG: hypothetical protein COA67_03900 [Lutibacter sp.]|nr:MAG: hypothetical protein COA67_03900 [Lutibacter sp.]